MKETLFLIGMTIIFGISAGLILFVVIRIKIQLTDLARFYHFIIENLILSIICAILSYKFSNKSYPYSGLTILYICFTIIPITFLIFVAAVHIYATIIKILAIQQINIEKTTLIIFCQIWYYIFCVLNFIFLSVVARQPGNFNWLSLCCLGFKQCLKQCCRNYDEQNHQVLEYVMGIDDYRLDKMVYKWGSMGRILCEICRILCRENDILCRLQCGHAFHWNCFNEWLRLTPKAMCPNCRQALSTKLSSYH